MSRVTLLRAWLATLSPSLLPETAYTLAPASADASFRRYFRLTFSEASTYIVMDAPPEHEDCRPFIKIAELFSQTDVHVPKIFAQNLEQGFLLLSDLGNTTYLDVLNKTSARQLYAHANEALTAIQEISVPDVLPDYNRPMLERELNLFPDWYIAHHLKTTLDSQQKTIMRNVFDKLLANALTQPKVFVHRDYHSRNLMCFGENYPANPGVIDFQDAVYGPITYDVVSLYRDAYINWEEEEELDFVIRYWELARQKGLPVAENFDIFYRDYEWMGAQRQIKVLGIFARLCYRDGKENYLKDMPRVMTYLARTCERYGELRPFARLLNQLEQVAR